jgi:hypothetical protein
MHVKIARPEPPEIKPDVVAATHGATVPVDFETLVIAVESRMRARRRAMTAKGRARAKVTARLRSPRLLDEQLEELDERIGAEVRAMGT